MTNEIKKRKNGMNRDILLMIVSVFIAVFVWFIIMWADSSIAERTFTGIDVEMEESKTMMENGLSVIQNITSTISVTVSGKRSDVNKLKESDISAYVDLSDVTVAGDKSFTVIVNDINKVSVVDINPSVLNVKIDTKSSNEIQVFAEIKQAGFEDGVKISAIPMTEFITITGPASALNEIKYAQVDLYLGLGKIEKAMYVREQLKLIDKNGNEYKNSYVKTSVSDIEVYISVLTKKKVPLALKYKYGYFSERNTSIQMIPDSIEIEGSPDYINTINEIVVDVINERLIEDDIKLIRNIPLPDGVSGGIGAAEIDIKFIDSDKKTVTIKKSDIKVTEGELDYLIMGEDDIAVTVRGSVQDLNYFTKSRITASVDLSKVNEKGIHSVPLNISVNNNSSVYPIGEYVINVEIY